MTKTYRPGVYSQYDIISQRRSLQDRYAFCCGAAKVREGKSIPAGGVVQIHSRQELEEYFDAQGGALFCAVCGILLEQGYQIPGAKQKIALLYGKDADFPAVLSKAAALRDTYNVTVLQQAKKLGKQLGQLEAAGFAGAAFMDKDEVKIFAQQ